MGLGLCFTLGDGRSGRPLSLSPWVFWPLMEEVSADWESLGACQLNFKKILLILFVRLCACVCMRVYVYHMCAMNLSWSGPVYLESEVLVQKWDPCLAGWPLLS